LILVVDGTAPLSKQAQQKSRRFRNALGKQDDCGFDSACISPGTRFMNYLTKYIDWYIRKKISTDPTWKDLEVVFSNEKSPGEGEHTAINYIRFYGNPEESFCLHGLDADLIMLALATHFPNFWVLRDDIYGNAQFFSIDIGSTRKDLEKMLDWTTKENASQNYIPKDAVNDFVFLNFMVGNDFLPHIPSLEIIEGGIDLIVDVYKEIGYKHGHITEEKKDGLKFNKKVLKMFLEHISQYEQSSLENKLLKKDKYFPDLILESHAKFENEKYNIDMISYKKEYYEKNLKNPDQKQLCHEYLEGLQWVLTYYTKGVPNWKWLFKHNYAPFTSDIIQHIDDFEFPVYGRTIPTTPFQQLLCILPPSSADLLPAPLAALIKDKDSPLKKYYPDKFDIDLSGKKNDWQGIVLLPVIDFNEVREQYFKHIDKVDMKDIKRNITGKTFVYFYTDTPYLFRSYYGDIKYCRVKTEIIDL
jgi:5'-3' exoribonuclease 1